jgi:hypothetical protein
LAFRGNRIGNPVEIFAVHEYDGPALRGKSGEVACLVLGDTLF